MTKKQIIEMLNGNLADEQGAILEYMHYAFIITGPNRDPLHDAMEDLAKEEMRHAETFGEKIVALGGVPTTKLSPVEPAQPALNAICKRIIALETQAVQKYTEQINSLPPEEVALRLILEQVCADEVGHIETAELLMRKFG